MALEVVHTAEAFNECLNADDRLVLVDFEATWCAPCKLMAPEIEKLAESMENELNVVKVDVDELKELALKHEVQGVPTMIAFRKGKEVDRIVGYKPADTIVSIINSIK